MKYQKQKGFTLIEMIAVLGIFMVLTSIVVFNYSKFRSDTILTNMAYEVALTIREAQIYGVSARGSGNVNTPSFENAYGIFVPSSSVTQYHVFSDTSEPKDFRFTGTGCSPAVASGDTCMATYGFQNNIKILEVDVKIGNNTCAQANQLSISFKRPNPEPIIRRNNGNEPIEFAQITVATADNASKRYIVVYNNGQVGVLNDSQCP